MNFETLSSVFPIIVFQMFSTLSNISNGRVTVDVPSALSEGRSEFPALQHPRQNDAPYPHVKREKHLYSKLRALLCCGASAISHGAGTPSRAEAANPDRFEATNTTPTITQTIDDSSLQVNESRSQRTQQEHAFSSMLSSAAVLLNTSQRSPISTIESTESLRPLSAAVTDVVAANCQFIYDTIKKNLASKFVLKEHHKQIATVLLALQRALEFTGAKVDPAMPEFETILSEAANCVMETVKDSSSANFENQLKKNLKDLSSNVSVAFQTFYSAFDGTPFEKIKPENRALLCVDPMLLTAMKQLQEPCGASRSRHVPPYFACLFNSEKDYLYKMSEGWKFAFKDIDKRIDTQWIKEAHRHFTPGSKYTGEYLPLAMTFGINRPTEKGRQEFTQIAKEIQEITDGVLTLSVSADGKVTRSGRSFIEQIRWRKAQTLEDPIVSAIEKCLTKWINDYHQQISEATETEQQDRITDALIRRCELIHPFQDGNGRVFEYGTLNRLFAQQRRDLSIVDDPNKIDGSSSEEISPEFENGRQIVNEYMF